MPSDTFAAGIEAVPLSDCPIGLFWCGETLALKTEYGNNEGRIDAYIVSSGEFFWGPAPQSIQNQRACMVIPVDAATDIRRLTPTDTDTAIPAGVSADHRAHQVFDRWDKHPDAPAYWFRLPSWVQEYATACVTATEQRLAAASPNTDTAIPAGEVEEAVARVGRLIDEEGGGGGMTRPLSDGKRYIIMTFGQYERDLLTRYERGKAAASPKPDTDTRYTPEWIDALKNAPPLKVETQDGGKMPMLNVMPPTDTPVDPGVEGVDIADAHRFLSLSSGFGHMPATDGKRMAGFFYSNDVAAAADAMPAHAMSAIKRIIAALAAKPIAGMNAGEVEATPPSA